MPLRYLAALVLLSGALHGQRPLPPSQLFILHASSLLDSPWYDVKVSYLTAFNGNGYNNQPHFLDENTLLATLQTDPYKATEIYSFDLMHKTKRNLTRSLSAEYSPKALHGGKDSISYVRVPANDTTVQDLVASPVFRASDFRYLLRDFGTVAYYRQLSGELFVCYLLDGSHQLGLCDQSHGYKRMFASNPGQCFEVNRAGQILYVDKSLEAHWLLKSYDPNSQRSRTLGTMPAGTQDFALDASEQIYCASKGRILRLNANGLWNELIDLSTAGLRDIRRIAIRGNLLAFVNHPE
ncbi:MAG: hypothetical protein KBF37_00885 [Saprospiraceae bacterium]|jgi:hypothetical protein|nr:hypothetical protein [Saprospiraceae bacterium]MBP9208850.1 hypothetical protein [Saprospiraceae bacterium]